MTAAPELLGGDAMAAWLALSDVLRAMDDVGERPACEWAPDAWTSDAEPDDREHAAALCWRCPAQPQCHAFALANEETHHVWGGFDFTPRRGRPTRRETAA